MHGRSIIDHAFHEWLLYDNWALDP